jgi:PadR family transcriptional regulator, regulatory protein PadR
MAEILGNFEQAVLLSLLHPSTELGKKGYGRAVFKEVQARLGREVSTGAVYATLDRLESKGLLSSRTESGGDSRDNRPRRYYRVEHAGIVALREARAANARLWAGVRLPSKGIA